MNISREASNSQSVSYSFYVINLGTGAARIYTNLLLAIITIIGSSEWNTLIGLYPSRYCALIG